MSIGLGSRVGPYEVTAFIGEGGMGKVWKARHTALNRDDALKVLPETFASDPERLARFRREAQVLASVNHPNIAQVHGFEQVDGVPALVMELVEGPTLADRIAQGPIPIDEALAMAKQIAEGVEAAHEQGIIHRDLKPANIKVRPDGTVKVLDFGLAKALEPVAPAGVNVTASPTITSPVMMTGVGVLLGTAAYMSPEQARGRIVDKRSDIWAFGCVLYEMLAGAPSFSGTDATEIIAAVVRAEPEWSALPAGTPARIAALVRRCLQKDSKQRLRDIGEARVELTEALEAPAETRGAPASTMPMPFWRHALPITAAAVVTGVLAGYGGWMLRQEPPRSVVRYRIALAEGEEFTPNGRTGLAISPSGGAIVYTANGRTNLRVLDQLESVPIRGTESPEGAAFTSTLAGRNPFFSPDGRWIGFWQAGELKKVPIGGGTPVTLCATTQPLGASWTANDTILFSEPAGIMRVPAAGGTPEVLIALSEGEAAQGPQALPGGDILFTLRPKGTASWDDAQIVAHSLETGTRTLLISGGTDGRYVSTGHLVYTRQGTLFAAPFDVDALEVTGDSVAMIENIATVGAGGVSGAAQFALSTEGTLTYVPDVPGFTERTLTWVNRQGHEEPVNAPPRLYYTLRLSPDDTRVAFNTRDQDWDIWTWDFGRATSTRLTFDTSRQSTPVWLPDGQHVIFNEELTGLYSRRADGTGGTERLTQARTWQLPTSISTDGRYLVFREETPDSNGFASLEGSDLMVMELQGDRRVRPLVRTAFTEIGGEISPDGRWLVYQSNESGQFEIYVRPFPNIDEGRWQISPDGGVMPAWSRNGAELFYVTTTGDALMAVAITSSGAAFSAKPPTKLLDARTYFVGASQRSYDVSADGQRFLMIKAGGADETPPQIVVVHNWTEELKRLVPAN